MGRRKLYEHCTVEDCVEPNASKGLCMKHRRSLVGNWLERRRSKTQEDSVD